MMKRCLFALGLCLASAIAFAGAWGPGSFDNDDALDWVQRCLQSTGAAVVAPTLRTAAQAGPLDAQDAAMAIVAAEIVAAARGKPNMNLSQ